MHNQELDHCFLQHTAPQHTNLNSRKYIGAEIRAEVPALVTSGRRARNTPYSDHRWLPSGTRTQRSCL